MTPRKQPPPKPDRNRRREPRLRLSGEVLATVQTAFTASVIDLSTGGAQIDVGYTLKPGGPCVLGLPLGGGRVLKVYGRVLRSTLHALRPAGGGEAVAHYRAAIVFDALTADQRTGIEELLLDFEGHLDGQVAAEIDRAALSPDAPVLELDADLPPEPEPGAEDADAELEPDPDAA